MGYILGGLCIVAAFYGYYKYRFIFNPITSMFFIWGIILSISELGLYSTVVPSDKFYLIAAFGLLAFFLGTLLGSKDIRITLGKRNVATYSGLRSKQSVYTINYNLMYILGAISLIYYFIQLAVVVRLLLSGYDYSYIRTLAVSVDENGLNSSQLFTVLYNFIASPTTYLLIALLPIEIFFGKRKKLFIAECIMVMVLFVLTTGGRSVILWFGIYLLLVFLLYCKFNKINNIRISKKYKRLLIVCGIALFMFLFYMTLSRRSGDVDFVKEIFLYFVAPLPHADHYFDVVDKSGKYGYGVSSFYGLLYPFFFLLRLIGIFNGYPEFITEIRYMSFDMMETGYYIGGGIYMNAFVTAFYQPYLDGRYLGVFIIMLLFGFVCNLYFVRAYKEKDVKAMLIYCLLLQKVIFSFVRFYFTQQAQSLCFLLAFLAIRRGFKQL
ncbi:MAG: oligosaccharide repeat unit polymerase [Lachnospiraceae bacterium]|nr:oligosaccharide repeat unit polymerase [Lachnospiraceae bacterium]